MLLHSFSSKPSTLTFKKQDKKKKSFKELLKEKQKLSKKDYGKNDLFKNFISDRP